MIFLTVGSELSFDRLVKAVDEWAIANNRKDIIGQIATPGPMGYWPKQIQSYGFITAEEYGYYFDKAELIIAHAGMGSIITAAMKKKPIIVMPRRAELKETRNDHQLATVERFSTRKGVLVAKDESAIAQLLESWMTSLRHQQTDDVREYAEDSLLHELRSFILNPQP